jgi:hypothetical protein
LAYVSKDAEREWFVRVAYASADAAVAFLYILMALIEGTFGLQCHRYVAAVTRTMVYLGIFDFGGGFGAFEGVGCEGWLEGFAIVSAAFERPYVQITDGPSLSYLVNRGRELLSGGRQTFIPISIPLGWP